MTNELIRKSVNKRDNEVITSAMKLVVPRVLFNLKDFIFVKKASYLEDKISIRRSLS